MGLTADIKQWFLKTLPGMNNLVEPLDLQDKWVEVAQNCRFEEKPGSVDKRAPITFLNTTTLGSAAYGVTGLHRYYTSGGTSTWIAIHNTTAYKVTDAGAATAIRTGLTAGKRASFTVYRDLLIVGNGYDNPWVYDGASDNVTWELGACKAVSTTAATGSLDAATYGYQVAITVSGSTYVCGSISNVVTALGTAGSVSLTNIPLGPSGTTNRLIYRTDGGADTTVHGNYKLLATIADNTTTTYSDTTGDVGLGAAMAAVSDDMPKCAELRTHRERLFMTRNPTYPNKIYYSDPWVPHFIQHTTSLSYMEISPDDGDEISGIPIQLGTMVCIKKNTIRKLHITSPVSGADPGTWYADDPISWTGSPAPWSITQTPYGIAMLGWDHWYMFNGQELTPIIDEFDIKDMLEANYNDTVGFFHKGELLAAYTDKSTGNQYHDRTMVFNFNRNALSYDNWTSSTISGPNCFAAKTGDDEAGEVFYGDSQAGYILKDQETESSYILNNKQECNAGTASNVFIGGTEASPYMEIGSVSSATAIADNLCIFWESTNTTPGAGWVEITETYTGRFIKINATALTTGGGSGHTHTITGTIPSYSSSLVNSGDGNANATRWAHSHDVSITSSSTTAEPRHVKFRIFKASSCTTTEFPDGAIVMWDQETAPVGWQLMGNVGYYIKIGSTSLNTPVSSNHSHAFTGTSGIDNSSSVGDSDSGSNCARYQHTHSFSGNTYTTNLDTWELTYVGFSFIKKIGESDTWDGTDKYVYTVFAGTATAASIGWTDATSTYPNRCLKISSGVTSTTDDANVSHTHEIAPVTTNNVSAYWGNDGYNAQCQTGHTHVISFNTTGATEADEPPFVTFRLYKKILGQMKNYNTATVTPSTAGTWTSVVMQLNPKSFGLMYWNEDIDAPTTDNVLVYLKTGASAAACAASTAWSTAMTNPNGSIIDASADTWVQYKIEFTADDTTVNNPRVYFTNGYLVKFMYTASSTYAESSVNWQYKVGFRNFDEPMLDKIFKKIKTVHEGSEGAFYVDWETENSTALTTFSIDLTRFPKHWESYFQSSAYGKEINFIFYKNDLYSFRLSEVKGLYSPMPLVV